MHLEQFWFSHFKGGQLGKQVSVFWKHTGTLPPIRASASAPSPMQALSISKTCIKHSLATLATSWDLF